MKVSPRGVGLLVLAALPLTGAMAQTPDAKPLLSPVFTDHLVLQRDRQDPVWGWAAPGTKVTVTINGKSASATAGADGKWIARLPALTAGGPYDLTVAGPTTTTLHDILVGDVWICSGQSNMEFGVGNLAASATEIAAANYPNIRIFTTAKKTALTPQDLTTGHWDAVTPETIAGQGTWSGFSAVGYFFGRELNQKLNIPIGLIQTSWGGTIAESWTSEKSLDKLADFHPGLDAVRVKRSAVNNTVSYAQQWKDWYTANDPGTKANWGDPSLDASDWKTMTLPTAWESAGVPELAAFDGLVWFRKEIDLPAGAENNDLTLRLGKVDDNDMTWVNGVPVGATEGWDQSRVYTIPKSALRAGKNVITVRVLDTGGGGGIYDGTNALRLEIPGGDPVSLAGPWQYKIAAPLAQTKPVPQNIGDGNPNVVTVLYNGMVQPLVPYGVKGAIWYQGESNADRAYQYRALLPTMIGDWRKQWGEGDFPFYIVQLANWTPVLDQPGDSNWAELREAQTMTSKNVKNSGEALAIDIGDGPDIHPKDKQDVGRRLALTALAKTYGQKVEYSGPEYKSYKVEGSKVRVSFDHLGGGLTVSTVTPLSDYLTRTGAFTPTVDPSPTAAVKGFAVAGDDHKWYWADAVIDGDTIVLSSPSVASPVAVRYAWANNPVTNLYNKAGLPAVPFRTDDWPGVTVKNK
ncbi:9-O-acetylesterase [Capsulimonas corticalis]|uniref:9-O-acetylesterase n=1 Tax=Capsulimonas corticalis TaxID=2219043 RepID=A0A402D243_9BACT|nr:sialate O-acetylesterase [Capsulimonas corticalis]BDI30166.1 9-O-acetylesterase [Capsulimonas corticalis]